MGISYMRLNKCFLRDSIVNIDCDTNFLIYSAIVLMAEDSREKYVLGKKR